MIRREYIYVSRTNARASVGRRSSSEHHLESAENRTHRASDLHAPPTFVSAIARPGGRSDVPPRGVGFFRRVEPTQSDSGNLVLVTNGRASGLALECAPGATVRDEEPAVLSVRATQASTSRARRRALLRRAAPLRPVRGLRRAERAVLRARDHVTSYDRSFEVNVVTENDKKKQR